MFWLALKTLLHEKGRLFDEAAVADMELAKKNLERYESLFREGVIPKAMLDERENAFRVASSRMKAAEEEKRLTEKGPKEETLQWM